MPNALPSNCRGCFWGDSVRGSWKINSQFGAQSWKAPGKERGFKHYNTGASVVRSVLTTDFDTEIMVLFTVFAQRF